MSDSDENPFLITPPPGIAIPQAVPPASTPDPETTQQADPDAFITLPPGVLDSGTYRVANPRIVPPKTERKTDEIVFFPAAPGMRPPAAASAAPVIDEEDPEETRVGVPRRAARQWRLVLPDGVGAKAVDGALFVGRNPARTAEHPDAELLPLIDPAKSLSKTHALLEVADGQLWVHDLDSTNGVFIVQDNGDAVEVEPGTRESIAAGSALELGDYVIQVECS